MGLWRIPFHSGRPPGRPPEPEECTMETIQLPAHQINNLYHLPSVEARVAYIHACLGYPTKAMMMSAAAAGRLVGIPFATTANIRRFYPETTATPKGHLDQQRQGIRSTKASALEKLLEEEEASKPNLTKERDIYVQVWDLKNTTYSD